MRKVTSILLAVFVIMAIATSTVFATGTEFTLDNVKADVNNTASVQKIGMQIVGIVQVVGIIASVVILIVLGIKYMMGSAEEKAEYKKTLLPYFIGAIFIFAAVNVAKIIYGWAMGI